MNLELASEDLPLRAEIGTPDPNLTLPSDTLESLVPNVCSPDCWILQFGKAVCNRQCLYPNLYIVRQLQPAVSRQVRLISSFSQSSVGNEVSCQVSSTISIGSFESEDYVRANVGDLQLGSEIGPEGLQS